MKRGDPRSGVGVPVQPLNVEGEPLEVWKAVGEMEQASKSVSERR